MATTRFCGWFAAGQRSTTSLLQQRPSQATLSRLWNLLAQDNNRDALQEGLLGMAIWRLSSMRDGKPLPSVILGIHGLLIESFDSQSDTAYNPHVGYRHYSPLVASIAETGDMVGELLREGNSGNATHADQWIPRLVQRITLQSSSLLIGCCFPRFVGAGVTISFS